MTEDINRRIEEFSARQPPDMLQESRLRAERLAQLIESQEGEEYDVELQYANADAKPIFSIRAMAHGAETRFGVRHDEWGAWYPIRFRTRTTAETMRDWLLLNWLEGEEIILVENFQALEDET